MKKSFILLLAALLPFFACTGQKIMPLYSDSIPNSIPGPDEEKSTTQGILIISKVSRPTLTFYPAPRAIATGAAVIICPGGGYSILAAGHEGKDVALRFNEMGISAFVLKYRIPDKNTMPNKEIGPLQDAQRALQMVRQNAKKWKINPRRIGIMGFSAGGHLAATAGTHFDKALIDNPKKTSLRPDFLLLIYPVISFRDSIGHMGSRNQLLGPSPSLEKIEAYSNELQVRSNTPPAFLVHAKNDFVKIENSQLFAAALDQYKIPNQLLVYESGGHGYGMVNPTSPVRWMDELQQWLKKMKIIR
jgi:acetyl esterase/lipase